MYSFFLSVALNSIPKSEQCTNGSNYLLLLLLLLYVYLLWSLMVSVTIIFHSALCAYVWNGSEQTKSVTYSLIWRKILCIRRRCVLTHQRFGIMFFFFLRHSRERQRESHIFLLEHRDRSQSESLEWLWYERFAYSRCSSTIKPNGSVLISKPIEREREKDVST